MTAAEIRAAGIKLAQRTRAAQKLPRTVRDREAVRRVAALLVAKRGGR